MSGCLRRARPSWSRGGAEGGAQGAPRAAPPPPCATPPSALGPPTRCEAAPPSRKPRRGRGRGGEGGGEALCPGAGVREARTDWGLGPRWTLPLPGRLGSGPEGLRDHAPLICSPRAGALCVGGVRCDLAVHQETSRSPPSPILHPRDPASPRGHQDLTSDSQKTPDSQLSRPGPFLLPAGAPLHWTCTKVAGGHSPACLPGVPGGSLWVTWLGSSSSITLPSLEGESLHQEERGRPCQPRCPSGRTPFKSTGLGSLLRPCHCTARHRKCHRHLPQPLPFSSVKMCV